jgi:phage terminase large subunit
MLVDLPEKLGFLLERGKSIGEIVEGSKERGCEIVPHPNTSLDATIRWMVIYGGRDGAKSWSIGRALLTLGRVQSLRILCARELMSSMDESVHQLLCDQIKALDLEWFYKVDKKGITGRNATLFSYVGLRHNVLKVKSFEGYDITWVEEAKDVLQSSWLTLENTIRKPGSLIIVSFNPELADDATYKKLVLNPPPDALVVKMTWRDNPWCSEVLRVGREELKKSDPDEYDVVWEGTCRSAVAGAIYEKELRAARLAGRIMRVPYIKGRAVDTFWDLGKRDLTTIWFVQKVGFAWHIIDYYQNCALDLDHYLLVLQNRQYAYGLHWMPKDATHKRLGAKRTIEQQARDVLGLDKVRIVKAISIANGINVVRSIFPNCYFDEEKCADGLQALARYKYRVDPETKARSKDPDHTWSDGPDAFRAFAVSVREGAEMPPPVTEERPTPVVRDLAQRGVGWMRR